MFNNSSYDVMNQSSHIWCDHEPGNPWCGWSGWGRIAELAYLTIVIVMGTIGNSIVILSILVERRTHKHGSIFIINLAVADLMVTGIFAPTCFAHVLKANNALSNDACRATGYLVTVCCVCSMCNLTFIAIDRYCAIVRKRFHDNFFSRRRTIVMIFFIWLWSNLVTSPTLLGWSDLIYDTKMMACSWDDSISLTYNILLMILAVILPLFIITFCYLNLFKSVRYRSRSMKLLCINGHSKQKRKRSENFIKRELNLMKTLITTVCVMVLCWTPYALCIIIDSRGVNYQLKKVVGRLAISNSAVNFIIYGTMNRIYRRGYRNLIACVHLKKTKYRIGSMEKMRTLDSCQPHWYGSELRLLTKRKCQCIYDETKKTIPLQTLQYGRYIKNLTSHDCLGAPPD